MKLSLNIVGDDENNLPHKLLLTDTQVENVPKPFANKLSTDIKLSKSQLSKMVQSGGFLGRLLALLLKTGSLLIKNVIKPLVKSVLVPLGLTAAASAAEAGIHKKNLRIWSPSSFHPVLRPLSSAPKTTTLIIPND